MTCHFMNHEVVIHSFCTCFWMSDVGMSIPMFYTQRFKSQKQLQLDLDHNTDLFAVFIYTVYGCYAGKTHCLILLDEYWSFFKWQHIQTC